MSKADINKTTPEIEKYCTDFWDSNNIETSQLYSVPLKRAGLVTFPSSVGGPNWGPLSYNPQLGYVFINLHNSGVYRAAGAAAAGIGTTVGNLTPQFRMGIRNVGYGRPGWRRWRHRP